MGHRLTKEEVEYQVKTEEIKSEFQKVALINVLFVGPRRSGKSSIITQFLNNQYSNSYQATPKTDLCISPSFHSEIAVKMVNIKDVKHPVSLYIYDTPGDLDQIKEDAVIFPNVDIIFVVVDGDNEEQTLPKVIGGYNAYLSRNLAKYCPKAAAIVPSSVPGAISPSSPLSKRHKEASKSAEKKEDESKLNLEAAPIRGDARDEDDSLVTPLHYVTAGAGASSKEEEPGQYPKCVYVFTHRDKVEAKGVANSEAAHNQRMKLMRASIITKNTYPVSCRLYSDIHLMFKRELELKLKSDQLYKK